MLILAAHIHRLISTIQARMNGSYLLIPRDSQLHLFNPTSYLVFLWWSAPFGCWDSGDRLEVLGILLLKWEKEDWVFGKFYVLGSGMRRCNPTSLTSRFLCFIKFQIYLADMETLNVANMETIKGYSGKRKGTKHRVHKNENIFHINGQIWYFKSRVWIP